MLGEYAIVRLSQTCHPQTKSSVVLICLEDFFSCQFQYHGLHLCSPVLNEALNNQRQMVAVAEFQHLVETAQRLVEMAAE